MFTIQSNYAQTSMRAIVAMLTLVVLLFTAPFAFAASVTTIYGPDAATLNQGAPTYTSGSIDASGNENLTFSFDYNAEAQDSGDSFTYGWRTASSSNNNLGTIQGENEPATSTATSTTDETGFVSISLPAGAQVSDLEVYVMLDGSPSGSSTVELSNIQVTGSVVAAPVTINISTISELRSAIENQADGQIWIIADGDYGLDQSSTIQANNQTGWYFPITANNITIQGGGENTVIYGESFSANGNLSTQNLVSVFGDNVTISDMTLMPKVQPNKTVEVIGADFTIENVIFTPNTKVPDSTYDGTMNLDPGETNDDYKDWGGSLYFSHEGDHTVRNLTINNGGVSFRYSPAGTNITFENVQIVNETNVDWINAYRYSSGFNNGGSTTGAPVVTYKVNTTLNNLDSALSGAQDADTVELSGGTYSQNVALNTGVTLQAAAAENPIIKGQITVSSGDVTIDGLTITNPTGTKGISVSGVGGLTVTNNTFTEIGSDASTSGNVHAFWFQDGANDVSDLNISNNTFTTIGNSQGSSATAIGIGDSTGSTVVSDVTIDSNSISDITARFDVNYAGGGRGAYGIILNHAKIGQGGSVTDASITNNTINDLEGLWVHAIGLEGDTPNAEVTGNTISDITEHKAVLESSLDGAGIFFEQNNSYDTVKINQNNFNSDGTWYGIALHSSMIGTGSVDAEENYWGTTASSSVAARISTADSITIDYTPWLCTSAPSSQTTTDGTCTTTTTSSGGGGGGGSVSLSENNNNDEDTNTDNAPEGQVLGAATTNYLSTLTLTHQFNVNLGVGATGMDVIALQQILMHYGFLNSSLPQGYFGPLTEAAVKLYQAAHGIPQTGFVGPETRLALDQEIILTPEQRKEVLIQLIRQLIDLLTELKSMQ